VGETPTLDIQTKLIPEGDIWRLVSNSKLPDVQEVEEWIFDQVLPSIREKKVL
jgi:anti-repressor protein